MPVDRIPDRFRPKFCEQCGAPMLQGSEFNLFVCLGDKPHERWVQSPPVAYVVPVTENMDTVLVRRGIPPAVGGICFPGGYVDFGDTSEETAIYETRDEAATRLDPKNLVYLGEWYEQAGVTVRAFLARIRSGDIGSFTPNKESTERIVTNLFELNPETLAFKGNRLALAAAIRHIEIYGHNLPPFSGVRHVAG